MTPTGRPDAARFATLGLLAAALAVAAAPHAAGAAGPVAAPAAVPAAPAVPAPAVSAPAVSAPRETVTESLIRLLAEHNAILKSDAQSLIERLQAEQAVQEGPKVAAPAVAPVPVPGAAATVEGAPPAKDNGVHVFYVPESEKKKIRDEVKAQVLQQAKDENWAQPNAIPEWAHRFSFSGDLRLRQDQGTFDDNNNVPFLNFQALNAGAAVNINPNAGQLALPFIDTTEDRNQQRLRARLGVNAKVADDLSATFRLSTGNTSNPVSTNQTLGPSFNKLSFVVDRAYFDYRPLDGLALQAGRMASPVLSTELVFDDDLDFDGVALEYRRDVGYGITPFVTLGGFTVEDTSFDFPANFAFKTGSRDKSLFAAQIGASWKGSSGVGVKGAVAYYDWNKIVGVPSSPCVALTSADACDTDNSRPAFIQKGNTLFPIRTLSQLDSNPTAPEFQYFGLASQFRVLDVNMELDWTLDGPLHALLTGDFATNLAYDYRDIANKVPVNNYDACHTPGCTGHFHSGSIAYLGRLLVGYPTVTERWQWNFGGGYRRIGADAVPDGFNDSDFHLGGTNARGYDLQGALAFTHNGWVSVRFFSSSELTGPPLQIDTLFLDLNGRF